MRKCILIFLMGFGFQMNAIAGAFAEPFDTYLGDYSISRFDCSPETSVECAAITGVSISYVGAPAQLTLIEEGSAGKVMYPLFEMNKVGKYSIERAGTSYSGRWDLAIWEHFTQIPGLIESDTRSIGVFSGETTYTHDYRHYEKGMKPINERKQFVLLRK